MLVYSQTLRVEGIVRSSCPSQMAHPFWRFRPWRIVVQLLRDVISELCELDDTITLLGSLRV